MEQRFKFILLRGKRCMALALTLACAIASNAQLSGVVSNRASHEPLQFAIVTVEDATKKISSTTTDASGNYYFPTIANGDYTVRATYVGMKPFSRKVSVNGSTFLPIALSEQAVKLADVVVTATEGRGVTSTSRIDREAMRHLQPSSFTDLLSLLPGGRTSLPNLTSANTIKLREAATSGSGYDFSSLGTLFVTDGMPMSPNANMQQVRQATSGSAGDPDASRNHTASGIDMRTISTDEIESVEVIRGIAPVEYGDLTSGVVIINRKLEATPWEARFKADSYSKLLYVGKGMSWKQHAFVLNGGIDYLDAKSDPRNNLLNYKRLTATLRWQKRWLMANGMRLTWKSTNDYTGSIDNEKTDPEILKAKDDSYKSSYNRFSMSHRLALQLPSGRFLKSVQLDVSAAYERSRIDQNKFIQLQRDQAASVTLEEGEHDGVYLPLQYTAHVMVDGQPLNLYTKLKALAHNAMGRFSQSLNAGLEWKFDKNYGHGQVYDPRYPISPGTPYRPRVYSSIPAMQQLSAYVQEDFTANLIGGVARIQAGVRATMLPGLNSQYAMSGKVWADPRINAQWTFPAIAVGGKQLVIYASGGYGMMTKFPTLLQLYPDKVYTDIIELNYFNLNPDYRRLYLRTYIDNPTNYGLRPVRNHKWEARIGASCDGHSLSVTYFHESTNSGFRATSQVRPYSYRDYDEQSIDASQLTGQPQLADIAYADKTVLGGYSRVTNGSRMIKEGVEFQYASRRIEPIKTRFTVNGAWLRTTYSNSQAMFRSVTTKVINGTPVNDLYVGLYDYRDGQVVQRFNTNVMADTYIPRLGLTFSVTAECMWLQSSKRLAANGVPVAYMATDGKVHPFTDADLADPYKQWLVEHYNQGVFRKQTEPFYAYFNLKATKEFGSWMTLALFIDRILDYMPDYTTSSGLTVRRMTRPYFGMEMNFNF